MAHDSAGLARIRGAFTAAGVCGDVTRIVRLDGGENSRVFELTCAEASSSFVVKVYGDDLRWKMAKEVFVYGLLGSDAGVPTPEVLVADDSGALMPEAFLVMNKLPGALAAGVLSWVGPRELADVYRQMGAALRAFHRTTFGAFGYLSTGIVEPHPTNRAYMEHQFAKKLREFADLGGDEAVRRSAEDGVEASVSLLDGCSQAVLCHDDLHEANVLLVQNGGRWVIGGVLDVENAVAGDPLLDLAKTEYYAVRADPVKERALRQGYGPLREEAERTLVLYRLYHAIELWDWFAMNVNPEPLPSITEDIAALAQALH
jgi:hygromycin-B 7''-O-kinase